MGPTALPGLVASDEGLEALAQGMMFAEESGNGLFVGFRMDSISVRAIHRVGKHCFANDIVQFDGHLYLQ